MAERPRRIGPRGDDPRFDPVAAALNLSTLEFEGEVLGGKPIIKFTIATSAAENVTQGEPITVNARMGIDKAKEATAELERIIGVLEAMTDDEEDN